MMHATGTSPVIQLDPHDPSVLLQISPEVFEYRYDDDKLLVFERKCIRAMALDEDGSAKMFFTEDDFARSAAGNKNIATFISKMKKDYEKLLGKMDEKKDGVIKLKSTVIVAFEEICARAPSYFKRYLCGSDHMKSSPKKE